jgi:hypothetical protein
MLAVKKKTPAPVRKQTGKVLKFIPRIASNFTPSLFPAGKCRLGCGRQCATHSTTQICGTCLADLSKKRNQSEADRLRFKQKTAVRVAREGELEMHPKGYRYGRPEVTNGR